MNAVFDTIKELAGQQEDYIIRCRRTIHALAETAAQEFKTKAFILEQAKELGLPWEEVPTTSLIVKMDTGKPGPVVALRADIDALPMKEDPQNLKGPRTCVSSQENTCHACGHDAHSAMLLGAMRILHAIRGQLQGTVLFCFEEGEEPLTGVDALLQALEKYKVNRVWAIHVYAELEEGKISVEPGPRMAGACIPCVRFTGRSGHGSRPDLAINPLFCGASFLNNLCTAFCNEIPAGETVTMGITTFHCGTVNNIIDNTAEIGGSFRFFSKEAGEKAKEIFKRVAETTGAMYRCKVEFLPEFSFLNVPVVNDAACALSAQKVLAELFSGDVLASCPPWYAGESFARWLNRYPGALAFLGIRNPDAGYGAAHHNEKFDLNEAVLKEGAASTAACAARWLAELAETR